MKKENESVEKNQNGVKDVQKPMQFFDVVIVGGGVGGMSAAVYAKRRGLSVAIIEKFALGGTVNELMKISNFPSQTEIDGQSLSKLFLDQIKALEVKIIHDDVLSSSLKGEEKHLYGKKGEYVCKSVIIATGLTHCTLGLGEEELIGRGVSFCATCDANFFQGQDVALASKNGSGLKSSRVLAEVCKSVTIFDEGSFELPKKFQNEKIHLLTNAKIKSVQEKNSKILIQTENSSGQKTFSALFVDVGKKADVSAFDVETDENGFVLTDENMQTSVSHVFAVGDVRAKRLRQIVTACSDGAIAGTMC